MTDIDELESRIGETERSVQGFRIEARKVVEFAAAIGDDNPAYRDSGSTFAGRFTVSKSTSSSVRCSSVTFWRERPP